MLSAANDGPDYHLERRNKVKTDNPDVFSKVQIFLPYNQLLIANASLRILSLIFLASDSSQHGPLPLLAQAQFTAHEWQTLILLLNSYPQYVSYAELVAELTGRRLGPTIRLLEQRKREGMLHEELRPLRESISCLRHKLRKFGLGISVSREWGYRIIIEQLPESK